MIQLAYTNGERWYIVPGRWVDVHHTNHVMQCLQSRQALEQVEGQWHVCYIGILQHATGERLVYGWEARSTVVWPTYWMPLAESPAKAPHKVK